MKRFLFAVALLFSTPLLFTGCHGVGTTLEAGGAYTDPLLATTDRAILDASKALDDFVNWQRANADYLAKWPEIAKYADRVSANRDSWVKDAYAKRDAYASILKAYRDGKASGADVSEYRARMSAALAIINNVTAQITAYRLAHANA